MPVISEPEEKVDILDIKGDIDIFDMVWIKDQLDKLIEKDHKKIILYFRNTEHIDFIGLGMLVERLRRMRALNGDLKLVGLNPYVLKLLKMTGVSKLIETYDNTNDAIRSFKCA